MTDEELWSRYAAAALRNPPNEDVGMVPWATSWATKVADAMLIAHRERWPQKDKTTTDGELSAFFAGADKFAKAFSATNKEQP